jgi:hypothetical protein
MNVDELRQVIHDDRLSMVSEICNILGLSYRRILTQDLSTKQAAAKFVPRQLHDDGKQNRHSVCRVWNVVKKDRIVPSKIKQSRQHRETTVPEMPAAVGESWVQYRNG